MHGFHYHDSLTDFFPASLLPPEYGGEGPGLEGACQQWTNRLLQSERLLEQIAAHRTGDVAVGNQITGVEEDEVHHQEEQDEEEQEHHHQQEEEEEEVHQQEEQVYKQEEEVHQEEKEQEHHHQQEEEEVQQQEEQEAVGRS